MLLAVSLERISGAVREAIESIVTQIQNYKPDACLAYSTRGALTVQTGTDTRLSWTRTTYNAGPLWVDSAPTRLTIRRSGLYMVCGQTIWQAETNVGLRKVTIFKNGFRCAAHEHLFAGIGANTYTRAQQASAVLSLSAGDYLELVVWHDKGAPLTVMGYADCDSFLSAVQVG